MRDEQICEQWEGGGVSYQCIVNPSCPGNHSSKHEICAENYGVPLGYQIKWQAMHCDHAADIGLDPIYSNREVKEAILESLKLMLRQNERLRQIESAASEVLFTWDNCGSGSYADYSRSKKAHEALRSFLVAADPFKCTECKRKFEYPMFTGANHKLCGECASRLFPIG